MTLFSFLVQLLEILARLSFAALREIFLAARGRLMSSTRCSSAIRVSAPKGQQNIAQGFSQGFSPGLGVASRLEARYSAALNSPVDWQHQNEVFNGLAGYVTKGLALQDRSGAEGVRAAAVSPSYFGVLGLNAQLGRPFTPEEDIGFLVSWHYRRIGAPVFTQPSKRG